jgi:putative DNA primase/helicase
MSWRNFDDALRQLQDFGLLVEAQDLVIGTRQRCRHREGGREKRGWYQLFEIPTHDGSGSLLVGSYGVFWAADNVVQKLQLKRGDNEAMTAEQRAAIRQRIAEDKKRLEAELKRKQAECARRADMAWRGHCTEGSRDQSEYLKRKQIEPSGGRFLPGGKFVVPLCDTERRIHGLQVIYDTPQRGRDKSFWPAGLAKKGHFFLIGGIPDRLLLVCEGFATAASLHAATGLPVAVAFDAGNLLPVASALHKKYKRAKILLCADDDYRTEGNPGRTHAETAALAVEGRVVWPEFAAERPADTKGPTDFNDLHLLEGLTAVSRQVEAALDAHGWRPTPARAGVLAQGGGETPTERRGAQAIMELDDVVARFVPIDDGTGDYVFDLWTNKIVKRSQMIALLPAGVRNDDIKRHPVWITRGAYYLEQVGFDPGGRDPNVKLNTWRGWPLKPAPGKCDILLELIAYLTSAEKDGGAACEWLLDWMAYPLQHPGAKMASAVIMHGPQGTGKSTVFQTLAKIYGDYATVLNQRGLEDRFNSDWSDSKLYILAEEVVARQEMWHIKNELKELVTGEWIRINPKNIAAYRQRNQVNITYLSNENQPLPIDNDDRRHLVIYTPPALSEAFYDDLHIELENGGVLAFYDFLMRRDLSRFHPKKRPPMTNAKAKLIHLSLPSEIRFATEWITGELGLPVCPCLSTDLYAVYQRWCRTNGEIRPRPSNQFHGAIEHQQGWAKKKAKLYLRTHDADPSVKPVVFPPPAALAAAGNEMPPGASPTVWLGEQIRKFAEAASPDFGGAAA